MLPLSWNLAFKIHVILTVDALENDTAVSPILLKSNVRGKAWKYMHMRWKQNGIFKKYEKNPRSSLPEFHTWDCSSMPQLATI